MDFIFSPEVIHPLASLFSESSPGSAEHFIAELVADQGATGAITPAPDDIGALLKILEENHTLLVENHVYGDLVHMLGEREELLRDWAFLSSTEYKNHLYETVQDMRVAHNMVDKKIFDELDVAYSNMQSAVSYVDISGSLAQKMVDAALADHVVTDKEAILLRQVMSSFNAALHRCEIAHIELSLKIRTALAGQDL